MQTNLRAGRRRFRRVKCGGAGWTLGCTGRRSSKGDELKGGSSAPCFYGATFADLKLPLHITCTDIHTGELIVLNRHSYHGVYRQGGAGELRLTGHHPRRRGRGSPTD